MEPIVEHGNTEEIRAKCRSIGTYREEFEPLIGRLADLYRWREIAKADFEAGGCELVVTATNKTGAEYSARNPLLIEIEGLDKSILQTEKELGLTPAALKKINDEELAKKKRVEDDPLLVALSGLYEGASA